MSTTMSKKSAVDAVTAYTHAAIEQLRSSILGMSPDFLRAIMSRKEKSPSRCRCAATTASTRRFKDIACSTTMRADLSKVDCAFPPRSDLHEARTLAHLMSLKTAVVNIPFGGRQRRHRRGSKNALYA